VKIITLALVGAIVLAVAAALIFRDKGTAAPRPGAVWSPEHGHWH
jgi:hypothetical protein